ncbi:hypothetical protein ACEPAH_4807 [Sanghuangporus vaninii]
MVSYSQPSEPPVSSNIRLYLANAILPELILAPDAPSMPSERQKTHRINLAVRPERYRRLRNIHRIKREYLDVRCFDFLQKHISTTPVEVVNENPVVYDAPKLPCIGFQTDIDIPRALRRYDQLQTSWLEYSVLETVRAVLCLVPEYRNIVTCHQFVPNDPSRDDDSEVFRYFMWERASNVEAPSTSLGPSVKYILAYQLPWVLGPRDIELFADKRLKSLPSYEACIEDGQKRYNSTHKLWAKLWDICKLHDCHWFILTNYDQWVFGGFTEGWENGYTMGVIDGHGRDKPRLGANGEAILHRTPKLLEYLVYWTLSSMGVPDSFYIPPVPDEIPIEMAIDDSTYDTLPPHLLPNHPDFQAAHRNTPIIEPSESEWSAADTEVPSSVGVRFGAESDSGQTPPPFLSHTWRPPVNPVKKYTANWLSNTGPPDAIDVPPIPRAPSPVRSEWSDRSRATLQPFRHQGFFNIDTVIVEEVYEYDTCEMDLS